MFSSGLDLEQKLAFHRTRYVLVAGNDECQVLCQHPSANVQKAAGFSLIPSMFKGSHLFTVLSM